MAKTRVTLQLAEFEGRPGLQIQLPDPSTLDMLDKEVILFGPKPDDPHGARWADDPLPSKAKPSVGAYPAGTGSLVEVLKRHASIAETYFKGTEAVIVTFSAGTDTDAGVAAVREVLNSTDTFEIA